MRRAHKEGNSIATFRAPFCVSEKEGGGGSKRKGVHQIRPQVRECGSASGAIQHRSHCEKAEPRTPAARLRLFSEESLAKLKEWAWKSVPQG